MSGQPVSAVWSIGLLVTEFDGEFFVSVSGADPGLFYWSILRTWSS